MSIVKCHESRYVGILDNPPYRTRNIRNNYCVLLLGVKAKLFCTNRTIGMTSFSISTNRTIGTNGPSEVPCTQLNHIVSPVEPLE